MGLLFGLGLLAAAAVPDVYRSCKAKAYSDWETKTYGPFSPKAYDLVTDLIYGTHKCKQLYGFQVNAKEYNLRERTKAYEEKGDPKPHYHAIYDVAKQYCEEHDIMFTGKYVHTFYLPNTHSICR